MHSFKSYAIALFAVTVAFAADLPQTKKVVKADSQQVIVSKNVTEAKALNKKQIIPSSKTNWSKIKDMFM